MSREKLEKALEHLIHEDQEQAEERAGGKYNRGREFANAALEIVQFNKTWINQNKK